MQLKGKSRSLAGRFAVIVVGTSIVAATPVMAASRIFTIAGRGPVRGGLPFGTFGGDGRLATEADLATPTDVAVARNGTVLVADAENARVRRISQAGTIESVAGGGNRDPARARWATGARLSFPVAVELLPDGGFVVADAEASRVLRVGGTGSISVLAGTGSRGFSGDQGPATHAKLRFPSGVARTPDGAILIADTGNQRIRRVEPNGTIHTIAGNGTFGYAGDGAPAMTASFRAPTDVALDARGGILIADSENDRVRRINRNGIVRTVAGSGTRGFNGDGRPALLADLYQPLTSVARRYQVLIADAGNNRVRKVGKRGVINTLAGRGGVGGFGGDGGLVVRAQLRTPTATVPDPLGGVLLADTDNNVLRLVASSHTRRLAVALPRRVRRRRGCPIRVPYRVTRAGTLRVTLRRGERRWRLNGHARKGRHVASIGKLRAGRYTMRLLVRARDGQRTSQRTTLRILRTRARHC